MFSPVHVTGGDRKPKQPILKSAPVQPTIQPTTVILEDNELLEKYMRQQAALEELKVLFEKSKATYQNVITNQNEKINDLIEINNRLSSTQDSTISVDVKNAIQQVQVIDSKLAELEKTATNNVSMLEAEKIKQQKINNLFNGKPSQTVTRPKSTKK